MDIVKFTIDEIKVLNILDIKPNMYRITKRGDIINRNNQVLRPFVSNAGYLRINLMTKYGKSKNYTIHRLVALMFVDNPNGYSIVNHIDGNRLNNDSENLEWCSYRYNWECAKGQNRITNIGVTAFKHKPEKYSESLVIAICELLSTHPYKSNQIISILKLLPSNTLKSSHEYQCMKKFIKNIRQRRCWKHISCEYTWA